MCYIDYGNCEVINKFVLVHLPDELKNISPFCDRFIIDDMQLIDKDTKSEL